MKRSLRNKIAAAGGLIFFATQTFAEEKILLGSHVGSATIISISGVNSDRAVVKFRREIDDLVEDCVRNDGSVTDDAAVAAECAKWASSNPDRSITIRRANCARSTLYTEFGNYSMVNHEIEDDRMVRTDWKDHRTDKLIGNCGGCNTPQLVDTFKVLCPKWYRDIFMNLEPY